MSCASQTGGDVSREAGWPARLACGSAVRVPEASAVGGIAGALGGEIGGGAGNPNEGERGLLGGPRSAAEGMQSLPCQADERRRQEYALVEAACWTQCPAKARRWKRVEPHGVQHMSD